MSLDKDIVRNIANLARIEVLEDEIDSIVKELSNILQFVEQLSEVNTDDIIPMTVVADMKLPLRADVVTDGNCRDKVLINAPESFDGFFLVPKVVE
ncbi:MAG: Asp-tRNA(Asn)/Glu-tRNA(Gln) amidotransferase subunit GatC [Rhodospirillaceae bacterium]|nr:Asp-tRNA(Asn)/Glu-tRNA(Gln) amidotransferase subunit GatC [Rhodospirillaceae bacterium]